MIERPRLSLIRTAALSIAASVLGSVAASVMFFVIGVFGTGSIAQSFLIIPLVLMIVSPVGIIIATPVSLIIGAPSAWLMQRQIEKRPVLYAILLGAAGCMLGYPLEHYLDTNSIQRGDDAHLYMMWGAVIGASHAFVIAWYRRRLNGDTKAA